MQPGGQTSSVRMLMRIGPPVWCPAQQEKLQRPLWTAEPSPEPQLKTTGARAVTLQNVQRDQ